MNNLIQSITAYTTTLEQELSALEARVAQLEAQLEEANEAIRLLGERQEARGERQGEPEIEVELIMEDEEESPIQLPLDGKDDEEPIETLEIVGDPVVEEPAPAPMVELEPVVEPAPVVEKPAPRLAPQQTSLFGSAVEDIRQAISLGDRFLFQRELFGGNGELMQKTLDEINALGSLSEAMEYIADTFEWDNESTAVKLFENVLKRRFG